MDVWHESLHGSRWRSPRTLWVENGIEYSWEQVDAMAAAIEAAIGGARVVRIRSAAKLGFFAGQLAVWRAGRVAVADDGRLGAGELDRVRPDLTLAIHVDRTPLVEEVERVASALPGGRMPSEVVAVNFTSGSTGSRKVVAITRGNLAALFACRGLDVPFGGAALTAGSFATPTFDGWWFDTWHTASAGGAVVCLPSINEDVFAWQELAEKHAIDRVLLPAAVLATVVEVLPSCLAGIPWIFSGGEQFRASTVRRARDAGLANRFVNLYGPTEATFATHKYELPAHFAGDVIPIGRPLDGCHQTLEELDEPGTCELVVGGSFVCLGYLDGGVLTHRFEQTYRTRDIVRMIDDDLVYAGRLDSQIKVNGMRVDAADLEQRVIELPDVLDCRVVQDGSLTVAFIRADPAARPRVESVVRGFSPAIGVRLVNSFPIKPGGKIDTNALMNHDSGADKDGQA